MTKAVSPEEIQRLTPFELASYGGCSSPDSVDSPGAEFLTSIRDKVLEIWEDVGVLDNNDIHDTCWRIADEAPDYRTHHKWQEFVDLCAYEEEFEWPIESLDQAASVALFQIANRLAEELYRSLILWDEEQDEEEEDDDEEE